MQYRMLGNSSLRLSEIGFGTWGIGGDHGGSMAYGATDDKVSTAALEQSFDQGITFYDTSNLYGLGHAEELLGRFLKGKRKDCIISTKGGFTGDGYDQNFSVQYLTRSIEISLRRMSTDYIDLFMLHSPALSEVPLGQDLVDALEKHKDLGKIINWGISTQCPQDAIHYHKQFPVQCFQINFSLIDMRAIDCGLFEYAKANNIGLIARTPLAFGFLTGNINSRTAFDSSDHRKRFKEVAKERWSKAILDYQGCFDSGSTNAQNSLRFCLAYDAITSTIPGMLTPEHVNENASASNFPMLNFESIIKIKSIYDELYSDS